MMIVSLLSDDKGLACIGVQPLFKGGLFNAEDTAHLDGRKAFGAEQLIHAAAADVHNCHNVFGCVENGSVLNGCCGCLCCIHIDLPLSFVIFIVNGRWDNGAIDGLFVCGFLIYVGFGGLLCRDNGGTIIALSGTMTAFKQYRIKCVAFFASVSAVMFRWNI